MKCPNCGGRVSRGADICPDCGGRIERKPLSEKQMKWIPLCIALAVVLIVTAVVLLFTYLRVDEDEFLFDDTPYETIPMNVSSAHKFWEGDWYGWWIVANGSGEWEEEVGGYFDTCARIRFIDESRAELTIWDEQGFGENLAAAVVTFDAGATDVGCMVVESGEFRGYPIGEADWAVDPGYSEFTADFENFICINGFCTDPANEENEIEYQMFLRPWGTSWEDIRTADESRLYYDNMMPAMYDDWYLPQLEQSPKSAPAEFYGDDFEWELEPGDFEIVIDNASE